MGNRGHKWLYGPSGPRQSACVRQLRNKRLDVQILPRRRQQWIKRILLLTGGNCHPHSRVTTESRRQLTIYRCLLITIIGSCPLDTDPPPPVPNQQSQTSDMSNVCITRHPGERPLDVSFLDASGTTVGLKQLWRLNWSTTFNTAYADSMNKWPKWMGAYQ